MLAPWENGEASEWEKENLDSNTAQLLATFVSLPQIFSLSKREDIFFHTHYTHSVA